MGKKCILAVFFVVLLFLLGAVCFVIVKRPAFKAPQQNAIEKTEENVKKEETGIKPEVIKEAETHSVPQQNVEENSKETSNVNEVNSEEPSKETEEKSEKSSKEEKVEEPTEEIFEEPVVLTEEEEIPEELSEENVEDLGDGWENT